MEEGRWEPRKSDAGQYCLTWKGRDGNSYSAEGRGLDISRSGIGIECFRELKEGSIVHLQSRSGPLEADCEVVHCTRRGANFHIGLEFRDEPHHRPEGSSPDTRVEGEPDYYETLQISRKADLQTIVRVFRIMAARYHPDNRESGDLDQFLRMKQAYAVLSDPERRSEYDAMLDKSREEGPRPIFALKDFVTGVEAESNRRLGVLSLLYNQRFTNPENPGISLLDLEREMGFPREYLSFTLWYLRAKELVSVTDNSDYALTAAGADYVEEKAVRNEIVSKLLKPGAPHFPATGKAARTPQTRPAQPNAQFLLPASDSPASTGRA